MVARHIVLYLALTGINVGLVWLSGPARERPAAVTHTAAAPAPPQDAGLPGTVGRGEPTRLAQR